MLRIFRWLLKRLLIGVGLLIILLIGAGIVLYPTIQKMDLEVREIIEAHQSLEVSHPGWSFPGMLYSAPAPLSLPRKHRIAHAQFRNYTASCPATESGSYCAKDGVVIPRGGFFPEGIQPEDL